MAVTVNPTTTISNRQQVTFTNTDNIHVTHVLGDIPFNIKVLLDANSIGGFGLGGFGEGGFGEDQQFGPLFVTPTDNFDVFFEDDEFVVVLPTTGSGRIIYWV